MANLLFMTSDDYLNLYIPMIEIEEIEKAEVYNMSNGIKVEGEFKNSIAVSGFTPMSYVETQLTSGGNEKQYRKEYFKELDDIKLKSLIMIILMQILEENKTGIILSDEYEAENLFLLEMIKTYIEDEFNIKGYNLEEFFKNREACRIQNVEERLHEIRSLIYHKSRQYMFDIYTSMFSPKNPRLYFCREDLLDAGTELIRLAKELEIEEARKYPPNKLQLSVEERWELVDAVWKVVETKNRDFIETIKLDTCTLEELIWFGHRIEIKIPREYSRKEAHELMKRRVKDIDYEKDVYSRPRLNELETFELVENLIGEREKLITTIVTTKEGEVDVDCNSLESLMCKDKEKLIRMYINLFNGDPSILRDRDTMPKMLLCKLINIAYKTKMKIEFVSSLNMDYIIKTDMDLIKLDFMKYLYSVAIVECMKDLLKIANPTDVCYYLLGKFDLKNRVTEVGIDKILTKEKYQKLKTVDLEVYARAIGTPILAGMNRSTIIKYVDARIMNLGYSQSKIRRRSEVTIDNLMRLDSQKLIKFCKVHSIDYKYDWSKKKICREILEVVDRAKALEEIEKKKLLEGKIS